MFGNFTYDMPDPDPSPSDVAYDDMTRAWRNEDYPLAWSLADALLQYLANDGQPLTGDRDVYYARQIHAHYAPGSPSGWSESWPATLDTIDMQAARDAARYHD